jgi:hypothetical protein
MADAAGTADVAKTLLDATKKALESVAGEQKGATATPKETAPPPVKTGLDSGATVAVDRYRKTAHWVLAAFAAVGVLIFGSLPFADVAEQGHNHLLIVLGVIVAALGIGAAILAVSRVDEPEDASLGELKADLQELFGDLACKPKQPRRWKPRKRALWKLQRELAEDDGPNHVGPIYEGVDPGSSAVERISGLISSIGTAQRVRYSAAARAASAQARFDDSRAELAARAAEMQLAWDRWAKAVELAKPAGGGPSGDKPAGRGSSGAKS